MSVEVVTFGCRLNIAESEAIRRAAVGEGLSDTIVVNTCAVTAEAARQARQAIRRLRRERPGARIVVTGCAAQVEPHVFAAMGEVDRVVGNAEKFSPQAWSAHGCKTVVGDILAEPATAAPAPAIDAIAGHARTFVQVQTGCDHRCTFCIIPFARGPSRSVPMAAVAAQVRRIVDRGCHEVVLTGVDLTSYGRDLPGQPALGLLVKHVLAQVPELARLRLSSIDAAEADPDLIDAVATQERLMPHVHLSLQSGDDMILKRMKRRHSRVDAVALCAQLRRVRPGLVLGADIIAGFPTETEEMFARSLALVEDCGLTHLHVFPFSPRQGTPAARMPQVPHEIAKARAQRLRAAGEAALAHHLDGEVGRIRRVLTERGGIGRTEHSTAVRLPDGLEPGRLLDLVITGHDGRRLRGARVDAPAQAR